MPISGGEKLCPICDSPLQSGSKKCGFCGTDLSIFEIEVEAPKPAPPPAPPPRVSMEVKVQEVFSKQAPPEKSSPVVPPARSAAPPPQQLQPARPAPIPEPKPPPKAEPEAKPPPAKEPAKEVQEYFECPECGSSVPATASTCPKCGVMFAEEGAEMFQCPACNSLVDVEATSCPGCGALFVEPEEAAASSQAVKEPAAPSPAPSAKAVAAAAIAASTSAITAASATPMSQRAEEEPAPKAAPKSEEKRGFFGMFKSSKKEPEPPAKPAPKPGIRDVSAPPPVAVAVPRPSAAVPAAVAQPVTQKEAPSKADKGPELKRMVVEMKPLLALARERDVDIGESKQLIDQGATAGRERELDKAIELVRKSKAILISRIDASLGKDINSVNDEIKVAREFGGDVSRASTYMQEASRARETGDFEAAYVFLDKARNELQPITGRYNEYRTRIAALKDLIADCEFFVVDTKDARSLMVEATKALDAKDLDKVDSLLKNANDKLNKAIPGRMNEELQKAKDALINAKAANVNITPMITVLKSATSYMKNGDYAHALKEMREFKEMIKKVS